jgi:hypothetical protein
MHAGIPLIITYVVGGRDDDDPPPATPLPVLGSLRQATSKSIAGKQVSVYTQSTPASSSFRPGR